MKKIFLPLALVTATFIGFGSCKKNDAPVIPGIDDQASARMMRAFLRSMHPKRKRSVSMHLQVVRSL
ncbi:hypothetical protein [Niabella hibiscisoli]|uniref:hypothetical protein n=1 Tax=Niabella hibiscisoli TaxID=1825928 RepID=UPI001F10AC93|nr:hypothetical protein [Niabella hibiscisoli]MCH5716288.1 hypothetical protein [Niabella hibiscisoli]